MLVSISGGAKLWVRSLASFYHSDKKIFLRNIKQFEHVTIVLLSSLVWPLLEWNVWNVLTFTFRLLHKLVYFFIGLFIGIILSQVSRHLYIYLKNKNKFFKNTFLLLVIQEAEVWLLKLTAMGILINLQHWFTCYISFRFRALTML